jgi:hypothetical protein
MCDRNIDMFEPCILYCYSVGLEALTVVKMSMLYGKINRRFMGNYFPIMIITLMTDAVKCQSILPDCILQESLFHIR